jgi:hypothetical protein
MYSSEGLRFTPCLFSQVPLLCTLMEGLPGRDHGPLMRLTRGSQRVCDGSTFTAGQDNLDFSLSPRHT